MAKKKNKKAPNAVKPAEQVREVPKFEIGVKGDEFDIAYTKAARNATRDTDRLLYDLSRESRADKFNLMDALIPFIIILFTALAFITLSRGEAGEDFSLKFSLPALLDGSYTQTLDKAYSDTLPYGEELRYAASLFGFGYAEKPDWSVPEEPDKPNEPTVTEPVVTEPPVTTTVTTASEVITTPEITTTEEPRPVMARVNSPVNVRKEPNAQGERLGQLNTDEQVQVLDILDNGWYEIIYNGEVAYAYGEYLAVIEGEVTEPAETTAEVTTTEYSGDISVMYATRTLTIRLSPDSSGVNMGYYVMNDMVEVLSLREDGWAEIRYGNGIAYVQSDGLVYEPAVTEIEEEIIEEESEEISEEEQDNSEVTELPEEEILLDSEETAVTSAPEEETTSDTTAMDWSWLLSGRY